MRNDNNRNELSSFWNKYVDFDWRFGLGLLLVICIPRIILVLNANVTGVYNQVGLVMLISGVIPFIFLNAYSRNQIGIKAVNKFYRVAIACVLGLLASLILHLLGKELYGNSIENWFVYIGRSYQIANGISSDDKLILFIIMAITGMTFSPIGEEFFFRGVVHRSFSKSMGEQKASYMDSLAFAITHLAHFGLIYSNNTWKFYIMPAILWVVGMFMVSLLFFKMKKFTNSLWGAVACHAGFNLGMIYAIFYLL